MKRYIALALGLCILFTFVGCAHEHSFGEWETVKEATCTTEGSERRTCKCGEEEIQSIPINDVHEFDEYGYCKNCNKISDATMENLVEVVKTVCRAAWLLRYMNDSDHPSADNITIEFDSLTHEVSKPAYSGTGMAVIDFDGNYYTGDFDIDFKWKDDESRFVRDDGTFERYYICDSSGQVIPEVFSSRTTFTNIKSSSISLLIFEPNGNLTQEIYGSSGLINVSHATYNYVITRLDGGDFCWIITATTAGGNTETMRYFPSEKGLMWGDDAYLTSSD